MPARLTRADFQMAGRMIRTAALRAPTNQKAREAYARIGVLAGLSDKSMSEVERLVDRGDYANLHPLAYDVINDPNGNLWQQVVKGANAALKGSVVDEASEYQPGLKGTSGEDMAQVMSFGGVPFPGKAFDTRRRSYPDAEAGTMAAKIKGLLIDREPVFEPGWNIFMEAGREGKSAKDIRWFNQTLFNISRDLVRRWVRSIDAGQYVQLPAREEEMEMLIPGYEGTGDITALNLSNPYYLAAIDKAVSRLVSGSPAQLWLWEALTVASGPGNKPFVRPIRNGTPPLGLEAQKLMDWVEDNDYPPPSGGVRQLYKAWNKLYPKMVEAYNSLGDNVIERGLSTGPSAGLFRDPAVQAVYMEEIRSRRASARRASARRVAEKWIQEAIKRPGRLHEYFGVPEDKTIPMSKIKGEIKKLREKEKRTPEEVSLLQALNLAVTLKGMNKGAGLDPVSLGEMMMSAASQARMFHKLDMKRFVDGYEEVGMDLVRLGQLTKPEDREFFEREIDAGLKFLRSHNIKAMSEALEQMTHAYDLVAKAYR